MKNDGILEKGLEDLNAGQSHRERLLSEPPRQPSVDPLEEAKQFARQVGGASRSRGNGRGGRGGGIVGSKSSRNARRFVNDRIVLLYLLTANQNSSRRRTDDQGSTSTRIESHLTVYHWVAESSRATKD